MLVDIKCDGVSRGWSVLSTKLSWVDYAMSIKRNPIDLTRLLSNEQSISDAFFKNAPWPYVVIDDFLSPNDAILASSLFPKARSARRILGALLGGRSYRNELDGVDESIVSIIDSLDKPEFVSFLRRITGIRDLTPDPARLGAGLHQGFRGSYLRIHADHNVHPHDHGRYRRVNVLIYLNREWHTDWGGVLQLWDRSARECCISILPKFNRCIIMSVDDTTYHGYTRLRIPFSESRKAIVAYYYSRNPALKQGTEPHFSLFPHLPGVHWAFEMRHRIERELISRAESLFRIPS